ncbi:MAG TPA: outer membrane beta-barrel protein [Aquaticitalea sp.]|nr:outer membrane beta-barrel protein [Aquaticitalea sp.]HNU60020.1 outer membrane beta-barrel protein [Aquaticitalea sp.]
MKKIVFSVMLTALIGFALQAQNGSGFGIKGGLNYNGNGDYFETIGSSAKHPDRNIGYHLGIFAKVGNKIYFKPELVYTATKSTYDSEDFSMKKFDAPLLVGAKIIGPLSVFAGPSLQYIVDADFDGITIDDIENNFSIGLHFGIGVNINNIGIDLRYERGFNENEATFINDNFGSDVTSRLDTRPDQLILSLSLKL